MTPRRLRRLGRNSLAALLVLSIVSMALPPGLIPAWLPSAAPRPADAETVSSPRFVSAALMPNGQVGLVFNNVSGSSGETRFVRYTAEHGLAQSIQLSTAAPAYPQLAVLGTTLVAAYVDTRSPNSGKLILRSSTDNGATWSSESTPFGTETFDTTYFAPRVVASHSGATLYLFKATSGAVPTYRSTTDLSSWTSAAAAGDSSMRVVTGNNCGSAGQECYRAHAFGFMETATSGSWVYIAKSDAGFGQSGRGTQVGMLGGSWSTQVDHGGSGTISGGGESTATTFLGRDGSVYYLRAGGYGEDLYFQRSTDGGAHWDAQVHAYTPVPLPIYTTAAPVGLYVPGYSLGEYVWYAGFGGSEDTLRVIPLWDAPKAYPDTGTIRLLGSAGGDLDPGSAYEYNFGALLRSLGAGGYVTSATDLALPGRRLNLAFTRTSNAADGFESGPLGRGWSHSYSWSLLENGNLVTIRRGDGQQDRFTRNQDGTFAAPLGVFDVLTKNADSSYTLTLRNQVQYEFTGPTQTSTYPPAVQADSPAAYWRLGESSGTSAADAGPNGDTGTYSGGYTLAQTGALHDASTAVAFNGSTGKVTAGVTGVPTGTSARTIEAWVKPTGNGGTILATNAASGQKFIVQAFNSGGTWYLFTDGVNAANNLTLSGAEIPPAGQWSHIAFVFDGTANTWHYYLNGTATKSGTFAVSINTAALTSTTIADRLDYTQPFNGTIDEVAVYPSALSATRIAAHFQAGLAASWFYSYDGGSAHVATVTDPDGRKVVTNTFDSLGRLATQMDGLNKTTTFGYSSGATTVTDPRGHTTTMSYDSRNRPIQQDDPVGATTYHIYSTYDDCGNRSSVTDRNGNRTDFTFDTACKGNLAQRQEPQLNPQTPRFTTTWTYDTKNNPTQQTDAKGSVSTWTYDATTNVELSATAPIDGSTVATTKWIYGDTNNPGLPTRIVAPRGNTTGTPNNTYSTVLAYDSSGNLTSSTDADGSQTTYGYDSVGRQTTIVDPDGNASGGTPSQHTWTTAYDALDRVTSETDPLSHATSSTYDGAGNRTSSTDKNGNITAYTYNAAGRLSTIVQKPDPSGQPTLTYTTTIGRDDNANTTSMTQANGVVTNYAYDPLNRLTSMTTHPAGGTNLATTYTLDGNGNTLTRTTADSVVTTYSYDNLSRLTQVAASGLSAISYAYDELSRRTSMTDGTGTTTYSYDRMGRLTQGAQPNGTVSYGYDLDSNRTTLTYPGSYAVTHTYSNAGRLSSLQDWGSRTTTYTYSAAGLAATVTLPNGLVTTYTYDRAQRLTALTNVVGSTTITSHSYTLDNQGNRTAQTEFISGITTGASDSIGYTYDGLNRLTSLTTTNPEGFALDSASNLSSRTGPSATFTYDASNRITSDGSSAFTWSNADRLTARGPDSFGYDPLDRLTASTVSGSSRSYAYNGDGLMQSRTQGGSTTNFVWDSATSPSRLLQLGGDRVVYGLGPLYVVTASGTTTFARDGGKNVCAELNGSGAVIASFRYKAYGAIAQSSGASSPSYLGYAGQLLDPSGLYYMRARWYDPLVGRLLVRDPVRGDPTTPSTLNPFMYAAADPIGMADPSGLAANSGNDYGGGCDEYCIHQIALQGQTADDLELIDTGIGAANATADTLKGGRETATAVSRAVSAGESVGTPLRRIGTLTAFGRSPLFKTGVPALAALGFAVNTLTRVEKGQGVVEAILRSFFTAGGSLMGATVGGALCVGGVFGTGGLAIVGCPLAVGFGGVAGGWAGDRLGDLFFGAEN